MAQSITGAVRSEAGAEVRRRWMMLKLELLKLSSRNLLSSYSMLGG